MDNNIINNNIKIEQDSIFVINPCSSIHKTLCSVPTFDRISGFISLEVFTEYDD